MGTNWRTSKWKWSSSRCWGSTHSLSMTTCSSLLKEPKLTSKANNSKQFKSIAISHLHRCASHVQVMPHLLAQVISLRKRRWVHVAPFWIRHHKARESWKTQTSNAPATIMTPRMISSATTTALWTSISISIWWPAKWIAMDASNLTPLRKM